LGWRSQISCRKYFGVTAAKIPTTRRLQEFGAKYPNQVPAGGLFPFDSPMPLFNPPPGFQLRLGANPTDEFLSGTFPVGNQTIGLIRIPSFVPANEAHAIQQFQSEITFFQQNTGGLVVDVTAVGKYFAISNFKRTERSHLNSDDNSNSRGTKPNPEHNTDSISA
jgi:hypothetical protein